MSRPSDPISPELVGLLRRLKLGRCLDTLPERLTLARSQSLPHQDFLTLLLADEVSRRDHAAAELRARAAGLDPNMRLDTWDTTSSVGYDTSLWAELTTLRFLDAGHAVLILGPVGVGKTHLASTLGHIAVRRRYSVHLDRADRLFKQLKAARLDGSYDAELRRLLRVDLLILDDLCLRPLDGTETADFYELIAERHQRASTIATSNRDPSEWLNAMADPLLAQAAIDRLTGNAHELVVEGASYRQRQKPAAPLAPQPDNPARRPRGGRP